MEIQEIYNRKDETKVRKNRGEGKERKEKKKKKKKKNCTTPMEMSTVVSSS